LHSSTEAGTQAFSSEIGILSFLQHAINPEPYPELLGLGVHALNSDVGKCLFETTTAYLVWPEDLVPGDVKQGGIVRCPCHISCCVLQVVLNLLDRGGRELMIISP
jgi:hypothetical protein